MRWTLAVALGILAVAAGPAAASVPATVFTSSNASGDNAVLAYIHGADGSLTPAGSYPTGGTGSGGGLNNQGALAFGPGGRTLYAVNAGSDTISSFSVRGDRLSLLGSVASGGSTPVSIAVRDDRLYVLNGGGNSIAGFSGARSGRLAAIDGSVRALPGAGPAEVAFSSDGNRLIVTERNSNTIDTVPVAADGSAGDPVASASSGAVPFGFAVDKRGDVVVSEAGGGPAGTSAVSSYRVTSDGSLATISGSVPDTQNAACWLTVTRDGRFAYTANAGSATLSSYVLGHDGSLGLLDPVAAQTANGSHTTDLAQAGSAPELFALNAGTGALTGYVIGADGGLTASGVAGGVPTAATGLVAQ
jgi:6-phosphogluconolactonase